MKLKKERKIKKLTKNRKYLINIKFQLKFS